MAATTPSPLAALAAPLDDVQLLAVTLYGEARNEPLEGLLAVAWVIQNRVGKRFGKSVRKVCMAHAQFSCWFPYGGAANHEAVKALVTTLAAKTPVETQPYRQCAYVAFGVLHGWVVSNIGACNHYHTVSLVPRPGWAQKATPKHQKGAHLFYELP